MSQDTGVDWLTAAAAKFNEVYRDEGYEVVITLTDAEINATNEIKTPNRCTTDIFFEYNNVNALINQSRAILKKDGVALLDGFERRLEQPCGRRG